MATKARYTYDEKKDQYSDAGVGFGQGEANRMKKEYPEKMKRNEATAKNFPPAKAFADIAKTSMTSDLKEIEAAEAASAASHDRKKGRNMGDLK